MKNSSKLTTFTVLMLMVNLLFAQKAIVPIPKNDYWIGNGSNIYYNAGNVGIGVAEPIYKMHIVGNVTGWTTVITNNQSMANGLKIKAGYSGAGTTLMQLQSVDNINALTVKGNGKIGIGTDDPKFAMQIYRGHGSKLAFGDNNTFEDAFKRGGLNVLIGEYGTIDSDIMQVHGKKGIYFTYGNYRYGIEHIGMVIQKSGNVKINKKLWVKDEVIVNKTDPWPDFVFRKNYKLLTLEELQQFIDKNKHLPNLPTSSDIKKEGVKLAENQTLLLQKIEELTLYTIQQQKEIDELKMEFEKLKNKN